MTEMVERVARSICAHGGGGLCQTVGGAMGCKVGRGEGLDGPRCAASSDQLLLAGNIQAARAAIEAMNPPTEEMLDAAHEPARKAFIEFRDSNSVVSVICSESIWKAMHTAALVSQPPDRGGG